MSDEDWFDSLRMVTVVGRFDFGWVEVAEFAVEALVVEPADPGAGGDLEPLP